MYDYKIIIIIAIIALLLVLATGLTIHFKKRTTKQSKSLSINTEQLLEALGGQTNILSISLENKRLKVLLSNPKLVSQTLLKSMEISGFLTGKELKLLIKDNPVEVKNNLDKLRNEVRK